MVGNVNGIVESLYAADNVRTQQAATNSKSDNFSNYLNLALSNYQTGLLTGGLGSGYSYLNQLTGSTWQTAVLEALKEGFKKEQKSEDTSSGGQEEEGGANLAKQKKPDWATIRVIRHYQPPVMDENVKKQGVLV